MYVFPYIPLSVLTK
jgi:nucleoside-diphosphate-sugar epimerase